MHNIHHHKILLITIIDDVYAFLFFLIFFSHTLHLDHSFPSVHPRHSPISPRSTSVKQQASLGRVRVRVYLFYVIYLIIFIESLGFLIIQIRMDHQLHMPTDFFLSHLSFSDDCYSTAVCPKTLADLLARSSNSVPFLRCVTQFFIFCIVTDAECILLAMMAFVRQKAISNPLLYAVDMASKMCYQLLAVVYTVGIVDAVKYTTLTFRLSNEINHFFCDLPPLYLLSCSDIQVNELTLFIVFGFIELSIISGVLSSYCYIISSVLKIHSTEGRFKAFSTCSSHLTAVARSSKEKHYHNIFDTVGKNE